MGCNISYFLLTKDENHVLYVLFLEKSNYKELVSTFFLSSSLNVYFEVLIHVPYPSWPDCIQCFELLEVTLKLKMV